MTHTQRISPNAVGALKQALTAAFWRKKDLLAWLRSAVDDQQTLSGIDWLDADVPKRDSVEIFVDRLAARQDVYRDQLLRLMADLVAMDDFPQLAWTDDAERKITEAKATIARLKTYMQPYEAQLAAAEADRQRIGRAREEAKLARASVQAIELLKTRYFELLAFSDARARGLAFEPFLRELLDVFDLDPRGAFKITGEQLDGGLTLDDFHFLLEAKWQKDPTPRADLDIFRAKVQEKAENTLGLLISIEGFQDTAVSKHSGRGSPLLLMDGGDLLAVLERRMGLPDLLRAKRRHAAMTGEIYRTAFQILGAQQGPG